MNKLFTSIAIFFISLSSFAQKGATIMGTITDGNQKTLESATITLLNSKDSSVVKFTIASKDGEYRFENIQPGKYRVSVTAVGHERNTTGDILVAGSAETVQVPLITLTPVSKSMSGVTVTARRPLVEQRVDRTIINVEASVTNAGASALEVLEKSPGVTVDKDGNISLKGKEGVMVLVDGRPTQLGGSDLANLLRNMNSNQLDQIEIMTNPPARFDAAGNAGVINIKTKKSKTAGYNGSVTLGYSQGVYPKSNEGLNFNYRHNKVNLFTNLSHNYRKNFNTLTIQRNLMHSGTKEVENYFDQTANMQNYGNSYNVKLGADYFASKNTTVGVVLNGFSSPSTWTNRNVSMISDKFRELQGETRASVQNLMDFRNFSTNLNFRTILDTTGKEITADADYLSYDRRTNQTLINSYFDAQGSPTVAADTLLGLLPQVIDIYSGRIDYLHPLSKSARFEAGLKSSIVRTDNNAVYDSIQNGQTVRDTYRSNHFVYEENINAAYVNLSTPLSTKLTAQLGLRYENTIAKGFQKTTNQNFERNYSQLFPTAYFQYKLSDKNNLGVNYGRRIRRPNYQSLNPFIEFLDRYTFQQGNPDLKPMISDNIEISHTYKNFLTTTLNYSTTKDVIQQVIEQKGEEAYATQANIAKMNQIGIAVSANMPLNKWWTNSLYVNVFRNEYVGVVNDEPISFAATSLSLNGSQQFKIGKLTTAELSGFYRTSGVEGVIVIRPMGMLSAGVSRQIMQNKGTIRLTVRDVFLTQQFRASAKYGNVDASFQEVRDTRVLNVGFTYRFSKGKVNGGPKRRASSASDEQSRVGGN